MYTPGIHTNPKLIYADYAMPMVYKKESQTNRGGKVRAKIYKQNYMHTFTTTATTEKVKTTTKNKSNEKQQQQNRHNSTNDDIYINIKGERMGQ